MRTRSQTAKNLAKLAESTITRTKMLIESDDKIWTGAHVSNSGGDICTVFTRALEMDCRSFAFFFGTGRTWNTKFPNDDQCANFRTNLYKVGPQAIIPHGNYLINLGSADKSIFEKSYELFEREVTRAILQSALW
ncbi:hypothetical protein ACOME3_006387 [Neoechinorhynchus agilis]